MSLSVSVNRSEALRYLGVHGQPEPALLAQLERACAAVEAAATPRFVYRYFPISGSGPIQVEGAALTLSGDAIARHLKGCHGCYLLAATLGPAADRAIALAQATDMAFAVMVDAAASDGIEFVCEWAQSQISFTEKEQGRFITGRFSPGYGDLPITMQRQLLTAVDAGRKIGLSVTASNILLPQKSVTAVIGVANQPVGGMKKGCGSCSLREHCTYRKDGKTCGR